MKQIKRLTIIGLLLLSTGLYAQRANQWGFGIQLGDPTGLTVKKFMGSNNALNFNIGNSYFGELRIGADYLWHFDAFRSDVVKMHAGFGGVLGFGDGNSAFYDDGPDNFYRRGDDDAGIAVRGIVGIDIYPRTSPFEIFLEFGPLIGLAPETGSAVDVAVGFRFYP